MFKRVLFTLGLALITSGFVYGQDNTLKGRVTDESSGKPLDFVNVAVFQDGNMVTGASTNEKGEYIIKPLSSGKYNIRFSFTGYTPKMIEDFEIRNGITKFLDATLSSGTTLTTITVTATKSLFEVGETKKTTEFTKDEMDKMTTRTVGDLLTNMSGVVVNSGGGMNFRGGREGGLKARVDGMEVHHSWVPDAAVGQATFIEGAIPAEYGDAEAVYDIETSAPSGRFNGSIEAYSHIDGYNNTSLRVNFTGPLAKNKEKDKVLLGFLLSGGGNYNAGGRYKGGTYYATDETIDYLTQNPFRLSDQSSQIVYNARYVTKYKEDEVLSLAKKPRRLAQDAWRASGDMMGKLDFRHKGINLILSGWVNYLQGRDFDWKNSLFNSQNNRTVKNFVWYVNARFRHTLNLSDSSKIKNAYYRVQFYYTQDKRYYYSDLHKDNFFDYGYVGKFVTGLERRYEPIDRNAPIVCPDGTTITDGQVMVQDAEVITSFTPGDKNPALANFTQAVFNQYPITRMDEIQGYGGLMNGDYPLDQTGIYGVGFRLPGVPYNGYSKSKYDKIGASAFFSFDVGNHNIRLGFDFLQTTYHNWGLNPAQLWNVMYRLTNLHRKELDKSNPILIYDENGLFTNKIEYDYLEGEMSNFDAELRAELKIKKDEWVDIHSYDPSTFKLEMLSAEELFNNGGGNALLSFYGYDYLGNKYVNRPITISDLKNWFGDDAKKRDFSVIGASKPLRISAYIQDNFSIRSLYFNLGLRLDVFDHNQPYVKDMFLYRGEAHTVVTAKSAGLINAAPDGVGDDAVVYVKDPLADDPTVVAYRQGYTWYDASGQEVADAEKLASSVGETHLNPLFNKDFGIVDKTDRNTHHSAFADYTPTFANGGIALSPRIGFSFAVGESSKFTASYNILTTSEYSALEPVKYLFFSTSAARSQNYPFSNPGLKPEKSIIYEVGFQQALTKDLSVEFSAYYSEKRDQISLYRFVQAYPETYYSYTNMDFGTVQGFKLGLQARKSSNFTLYAHYVLQFAKGTASEAGSNVSLLASGAPNLRTLTTLAYDQRHQISLQFYYDFGMGTTYTGPKMKYQNKKGQVKERNPLQGINISMSLKAGSGLPYTRSSEPYSGIVNLGQRVVVGSINGSRLPWQFNADLSISKTFMLVLKKDEDAKKQKMGSLQIRLDIRNVLGIKNVTSVYPYTGDPQDDGFLTSSKYQDYVATQENPQSFWDYYTIVMNRAWNNPLGAPTTATLGIKFMF